MGINGRENENYCLGFEVCWRIMKRYIGITSYSHIPNSLSQMEITI